MWCAGAYTWYPPCSRVNFSKNVNDMVHMRVPDIPRAPGWTSQSPWVWRPSPCSGGSWLFRTPQCLKKRIQYINYMFNELPKNIFLRVLGSTYVPVDDIKRVGQYLCRWYLRPWAADTWAPKIFITLQAINWSLTCFYVQWEHCMLISFLKLGPIDIN